jgi:hypothetical protein
MPPCIARVQRFDAPVEHLREAGQFGNRRGGKPVLVEQLGCPAGRDKLDPAIMERGRELGDARFVTHRNQRASDAHSGLGRFGHVGMSPGDAGRISGS